MKDVPTNNQETVFCHCSGTTTAKIISLIERGIDTIDTISSATGACTGCGSCDAALLELLEETQKEKR